MTTTNDNEQNVPETNEPLYTAADEENVAPAAEEVAIPLGGDCLEEETVSVSEATEAPISEEAVEASVTHRSNSCHSLLFLIAPPSPAASAAGFFMQAYLDSVL